MEDSAGHPPGIRQTRGGLIVDDAGEGRLHIDYALLRLFSEARTRKEYLDSIAHLAHRWAGFRCVGIRMPDSQGNIPYESYTGFSQAFWKSENLLSVKKHDCACTRVILGKVDPGKGDLCTKNGSFLCGNLPDFLDGVNKQQRKRFRSACKNFGFRSIAVVPIRYKGNIIGAIHMADEAEGKSSPGVLAFIESLTPLIGSALHRFGTEESLAEAELYLKNDLLDTMYAGTGLMVAYMDRDFNFIRVNRAYARADGHEPEYYTGRNHFDLFPDDKNEAVFRRVAETGQGFSVKAKPFEYPLNPERGKTYRDWSLQPLHEGDGSVSGVVLSLIDVTDRERARQALEERTRHAESLARIAGRLNSTLDIEAVEAELCREAALALDMPAASVSLFDWKTGSLVQSTSYGLPSDFCTSMEPLVPSSMGSPANEDSQVYFFPEIRNSGLPSQELYHRLDIRTRVSALMEREGELVGSLNLYSTGEPRQFSGDDISLLQALASQGAMAISNASLFEEAEHRLEQIVALRRIDTAITSSLDLQFTLNVFLQQVIAQLGVDAADILLLNKANNRLEFAAGKGFRSAALQYSSLEMGQGIAGKVAIDRRMVRVDDRERLQHEFTSSRHFASEGFRLYHAIPLISRGQIKGVLEVFQRRLMEPQPEWLELLQTFASQGAIAVDNASLFSDLQRSNIELSQAYDATLEGWSHALELRDRETEGHTRRVADMTAELARRLGIPEADIINFRRGAILHDIGKMGIPDSILLKPGPLDEGEWEIMRMHTVYGHEMLSPIGYLRKAVDIPYCHHERWDGTGYPRGLKGEEIPLMARVFAFADVWDALSSDRPYRDAWPREKVLEHIRGAIGSHFDPNIGPVFLGMQL